VAASGLLTPLTIAEAAPGARRPRERATECTPARPSDDLSCVRDDDASRNPDTGGGQRGSRAGRARRRAARYRGLRPATFPQAIRPRGPQIWRSGLGWQRTALRPGPEHGPRGPAAGKGRPASATESSSSSARERPQHGPPPGAGPGPGSNEEAPPSGPPPAAGHGPSTEVGWDHGQCGRSRAGAPRPADCAPGPNTIPIVGSMVTPARPRPSMCRHPAPTALVEHRALVAWSIRR
jgi:hypothetical protein